MKYAFLFLLFVSSAQAAFIPVRKERLLYYLPLSEGQGTELRTYSGHSDTATIVGPVAWVKDPGGYATEFGTRTWAPSMDGGLFFPNSAETRVETPPLERLNLNNRDFTIMWTGSFEPAANNAMLMYYVGGTGAGCGGRSGWGLWQQRVFAGRSIILSVANCGQALNYTPNNGNEDGAISDSFVHQWVITRSGQDLKWYRDGKFLGGALMAGAFGDAGTQILNIGDGFSGIAAGEFVGKMRNLAIWNIVLTDEEVKTLWNMQSERIAMK